MEQSNMEHSTCSHCEEYKKDILKLKNRKMYKNLREENEKLKQENEWNKSAVLKWNDAEKKIQELEAYAKDGEEKWQELLKENENLKEEIANIATIKNKQIKKEKYKYESMCSEQAKSDCAKYIKELNEENEKLKQENEWNKSAVLKWNDAEKKIQELEAYAKDGDEKWQELLKENEKLKGENEVGLTSRGTELKEENKKWKYWASEVVYWSHSASKQTLIKKKLITSDSKPTISDVRDFGREISELKEENEKIGNLCHSQTDKLREVSIKYNEGYKINQEFKKENEELKAELKDFVKLVDDNMQLNGVIKMIWDYFEFPSEEDGYTADVRRAEIFSYLIDKFADTQHIRDEILACIAGRGVAHVNQNVE